MAKLRVVVGRGANKLIKELTILRPKLKLKYEYSSTGDLYSLDIETRKRFIPSLAEIVRIVELIEKRREDEAKVTIYSEVKAVTGNGSVNFDTEADLAPDVAKGCKCPAGKRWDVMAIRGSQDTGDFKMNRFGGFWTRGNGSMTVVNFTAEKVHGEFFAGGLPMATGDYPIITVSDFVGAGNLSCAVVVKEYNV